MTERQALNLVKLTVVFTIAAVIGYAFGSLTGGLQWIN